MATRRWSVNDLPDMADKRMVITGGTSGIGLRAARLFLERRATVVIGARDPERGDAVVRELTREHPGRVTAEPLDLASLDSVRGFADTLLASGGPIDLLVNCAGVMAIPERQVTVDGFERHFGTNHLGHFALTMQLLPLLGAARSSRVLTVSAQSARTASLDLEDLQSERSYAPMRAYSRSKLANVLFAVELGERLRNTSIDSVPVHPGTANTGIQQHQRGAATKWLGRRIMGAVGQPLDRVADPIAFAATTPDLTPSAFVAPTGLLELGGRPGLVPLPGAALDTRLRQALWQASERLSRTRL